MKKDKKFKIAVSYDISKKKNKDSSKKRRKKKKTVNRGKEVTVRESSPEMQIIYGEMKVGGITTYVDTNDDSKAYLVTGVEADENELIWTAKAAGSSGNDITIRLIDPGVNTGGITISVVGSAIELTLRRQSGSLSSTMNQVKSAIEGDVAADALVRVQKKDSSKNGIVKAVSTTNLAYGGGTWLHQVTTIAGHEINNLLKLYLDGQEVTFGATPDPRWGTGKWSNKVFMAWMSGTTTQEVQPDLNNQKPTDWTTDHRQRGCALVYTIFVWNENLFPEGDPDMTFLVQGKKCYDPRTATTVYTRNSALIVADYLMDTKFGFGIPLASIDMAALTTAADICDESVSLNPSGTEARYYTDGVFDSSEDKDSILEELLSAMDGSVVREGDSYIIYAGAYTAPVDTLNEGDLRDTMKVNTHVSRDDAFNVARGTFVSEKADYNETDIPHIKNSTYITEDGKEIHEDFSLNFVVRSGHAQRLLKIWLEKSRQGISVIYPMTLKGLKYRVGQFLQINNTRFGWTNKIFQIAGLDQVLDEDAAIGVDLELIESASGVWDWNSGEETVVDLSPNTNLPSPFNVQEPDNVVLTSGTSELYRRNDGTIFSRLKVAWEASATTYVVNGGYYEIQYRLSSPSNAWSQAIIVSGDITFYHILEVQDGYQYDVRIRAVNTLGYKSDWVEVIGHYVLGKTEPPSNVTVFSAAVSDIGIRFTFDKISDIDVDQYEIRQGAVWDSGITTVIGKIKASDGAVFLYQNLVAGDYVFLIKAQDTSRNYSLLPKSVAVTILLPNPARAFAPVAQNSVIMLDWIDPIPSTLSVIEYNVYKGDTFASSSKIGTVFGTFHTYIEKLGGTFTYWIEAVDAGGNISTPISGSVTVVPSDDFYIQADQPLIDDLLTLNFAIQENDSIYAPIGRAGMGMPVPILLSDIAETFQEHFTNNSWTTMQDAIDDGFIYYASPGPNATAVIVFKFDYTVTFGSSFIDFSWIETALSGLCEVTASIEVSADDITYTEYTGRQAFAENFRYVRFILKVRGTDNISLSEFSDFRAVLSLYEEEEVGTITANSGDAGGTTVTFVKDFLDINDIQVSANSTTAAIPTYDFTDIPNPVSMKVLVFDAAGSRITKSVTYRIKGAVNP